MDNLLVDQVRLAHPNGILLGKLPRSLLDDSVGTARLLVEALGRTQILVASLDPDFALPESSQGWKSLVDDARAGGRRSSRVVLSIPVAPPAGRSPREIPEEDLVLPPSVKHITKAYQRLADLEIGLRDVVHEALKAQDSSYESRNATVHPYVKDAMAAQDDERVALGENTSDRLLDYMDFGAVWEILLSNWKVIGKRFRKLEKPFFSDAKTSLVSLRNAVMHSRVITQAQLREVEHIHHKIMSSLQRANP